MDNYQTTDRTRLRRRPTRGRFDRKTVHAYLDAGLVAHIGYTLDGQPLVIPTVYWREGEAVLWHGSRDGRAIAAFRKGLPVCFTVTHLDGVVAARAAFYHSVHYRSVMAFGTPEVIDDEASKREAMRGLVERLFPGRWAEIRQPNPTELGAISVLRLPLDEVSAKTRTEPGTYTDADLKLKVWAGVVPLALTTGEPQPCERLSPDIELPDYLKGWSLG